MGNRGIPRSQHSDSIELPRETNGTTTNLREIYGQSMEPVRYPHERGSMGEHHDPMGDSGKIHRRPIADPQTRTLNPLGAHGPPLGQHHELAGVLCVSMGYPRSSHGSPMGRHSGPMEDSGKKPRGKSMHGRPMGQCCKPAGDPWATRGGPMS